MENGNAFETQEVRLMSAGFVLRGEVSNLTAACEAIDDIVRHYKLRMVYKKASEGKLWISKVDPKIMVVPSLADELRDTIAEIDTGELRFVEVVEESEEIVDPVETFPEPVTEATTKEMRKRGRPKGSKNKPRAVE